MDRRELFRRQHQEAQESTRDATPPSNVDDDNEEEEKDYAAKSCIRAFNITGIIFGIALCGAALYATTLAIGPSAQSLAYGVAAANAALIVLTSIGFCAACGTLRLRLLLMYLAALAVLSFGYLVLSGFCFILTESLVAYAKQNYDTLSVSFAPALRSSLTLDKIVNGMRGFFYAFGALSFLEAIMCLGAVSSSIRLVTPLKAYTLLLQASNIAILPVGVVLIAIGELLAPWDPCKCKCTPVHSYGSTPAGAYLAETGIGANGPLAAFAMFVLGIIVIVIMLIGCMGTSLQAGFT